MVRNVFQLNHMDILVKLFSSGGFMPHEHGHWWDPSSVSLHVVSDALIALSYLTIPITLTYIVWKRKDVPFDWIFFCFAAFILSCGATHVMEIVTLWKPAYWLSGLMKAVTAAVSVMTVILLVRLIPQILAVPSLNKMAEANDAFRKEALGRGLAEDSLRRGEARLDTVIESVKDYAIITLDSEGHISSWNAGAEKIKGWKAEEIVGRHFSVFYPQEDLDRGKPEMELRVTAEKGRFEDEDWRLRKDGTRFWANVVITALRDASGQVYGFLKITRDVTERKKAEEEIEKLALVARETDNAVLRTDASGLIEWTNAGFTRLTGYTLEEVKGRKPGSFLQGPNTDPETLKMIRQRVKNEEAVEAEIVNYSKSGREYWVSLRIQPLHDANGRLTGFFSINSDITKRVREEKNQRRSQRLESIGTLAGGVAHDLNNALAPILMLCDILRSQYPNETRLVDAVESSAKRGAGMVRHLLTFAKGTEGSRALLDPGHLIEEMQNFMTSTFPKAIRVVIRKEAGLPMVVGDTTQLHQVLLNLCVNARDAMPEGGTLTLAAQGMEIDASYAATITDARPGKYLMLRVEDSGTGIPSEVLERIFDPFFSTKAPDKGTGLGLSTVMGIVKGHGGFLQVYSYPGEGSAFTVFIPTHKDENEVPAANAPEWKNFRGQGEVVLVVDDETAIRMAAHSVLTRLNFKVVEAADGAEGLRQASLRGDVRAVITDMHMPRLDGLGFVRGLRESRPDLPVVIASGRLEETVAAEFRNLGVLSRLDKPYTEKQLSETLSRLLGSQAAPSAKDAWR